MSYVANLILITSPDDGAMGNNADLVSAVQLGWALKRIQGYTGSQSILKKVSQFAGGNKRMEVDVFLCAVNNLDVKEFLDAVKAVQWEMPERVQVLLKNENDEKFNDITPKLTPRV